MTLLVTISLLSYYVILATSENEKKIIDGTESNPGQFPYAAAFYYEKSDGLHFCGGSLINDRWVLTAAHCLENAIYLRIILGTNYLNQTSTAGLIINSTSYVIHPTYNSSNLDGDVGLIYLENKVTFSNQIKPVELPTETLRVNEQTIALGWGSTKNDQHLPSNSLHHVTLTTIANAVCRRIYGGIIQDNMVCLNGIGNQGMCHGDSGGPLIKITSDGKNIQVGVASFYSGVGCETEHPSGYTRTFAYVDWIKNITRSGCIHINTKFLPIIFLLLLFY